MFLLIKNKIKISIVINNNNKKIYHIYRLENVSKNSSYYLMVQAKLILKITLIIFIGNIFLNRALSRFFVVVQTRSSLIASIKNIFILKLSAKTRWDYFLGLLV